MRDVIEIVLELPCEDIDQVMLFGNVQVTMQALQQLLRHGIELAIFTFSGKLLGQLTPPKSKNIDLRIAQFEKYKDQEFILDLAKRIVRAKLTNASILIHKHSWNQPGLFAEDELNKMDKFIERAQSAKTLDELRGYEGSGTACYFKLFGRMLKAPWKFKKRTRRPPQDPVNAVLSFGYVIVGAELQSLLDGVGFDPYLGFYHSSNYGRPSLALDLLEEFRHSLVDRLALNLFNLNIIHKEDFYRPPDGGVYLNFSGKKKFFEQYERMIGEYSAETDSAQKSKSFRALFQKQVQSLASSLTGKSEYTPFCINPK